jgi:hypothetical protein
MDTFTVAEGGYGWQAVTRDASGRRELVQSDRRTKRIMGNETPCQNVHVFLKIYTRTTVSNDDNSKHNTSNVYGTQLKSLIYKKVLVNLSTRTWTFLIPYDMINYGQVVYWSSRLDILLSLYGVKSLEIGVSTKGDHLVQARTSSWLGLPW